jgi:hypothetical protein
VVEVVVAVEVVVVAVAAAASFVSSALAGDTDAPAMPMANSALASKVLLWSNEILRARLLQLMNKPRLRKRQARTRIGRLNGALATGVTFQ